MGCSEEQVKLASEYIGRYLSDNGVALSEAQTQDLIRTCCNDLTSNACLESIAKVVAAKACDAYTSNACPMCCEYAGNLVGPLVIKGFSVAISCLGSTWELISGIFGNSQCDYDPAYNQALEGYNRAVQDLSEGYQKAYLEFIRHNEIPYFTELLAPYKASSGILRQVCLPNDPDRQGEMSWLSLLMWNAAILYRSHNDNPKVIDHGSNGYFIATKIEKEATPKQFFAVTWKHVPCSEYGSKLWQETTKGIFDKRWECVMQSHRIILQSMLGCMSSTKQTVFEGSTTAPKPSSSPTVELNRDAKARKILLSVFESVTGEKPSIQELQIVQALGRFEGRYGESRAKNNWGGVQCASKPPCPEGCLEYTDKHLDGSAYQGCLRVYPTSEDGAKDLVRLVTIKRPSVWSAMKKGDCGLVASEMRQTGYHETAPSVYAKAIYTNAQSIAQQMGESLMVRLGPTAEARQTGKSLLPLIVGLGGLILIGKRR